MSSFFNLGKKAVSGVGQAINKVKTNVPKTELQKKIRDLKIATQKAKAGTAKLNQTIFELKNNKDFTFKSNKGKSESNKEAYKRIQGENTKVLKGMLDKATEKKADGGRIGRKLGGGADMSKLSAKQMKIASLAGNKKKIDGADFKKLKAMKKNKTPLQKAVKV